MKRILAAFILAVLTHAALLAMGSKWLLCQTPVVPRTRVTTVRLVPRQPVGQPEIHPLPAAPLPLPPEPEPPPPPKPQVQKSVVQPKPIPKTPEKIVRPPEPTPPIVAAPTEPKPQPETPAPLEEKPVAAFDAKPNLSGSATPSPDREPPGESSSSDTATVVVLAKPRYSQNPPPDYPSIARRRRYQGTVILEVFVLENGQVGDLRVAESSNYTLLDRAAMKAVRRWQFDPARKGNREIAMWVKVPIRFDLK
ncbi:energy transducer TonB [uncultured Desulfosarcina sp.]|uniref:energy transducer TonB n=1 Tax=uncultured Desulfosarcina sp. TaxID=218289 RepID=UPI0029C799A3|nr:energy transducer TonB [uncultured Desulfosarcina sp.]